MKQDVAKRDARESARGRARLAGLPTILRAGCRRITGPMAIVLLNGSRR